MQLQEFSPIQGALARVTAEHDSDAIEQLFLPAGHRIRMDLKLLGNLGHGLLALQGFESDPGLERRGMVSSRSSHRICSFHRGNVQQSVHLSPRPKNRAISLNPDEMADADLKQSVTKLAPARTKQKLVKATARHLRSVQRAGPSGSCATSNTSQSAMSLESIVSMPDQ